MILSRTQTLTNFIFVVLAFYFSEGCSGSGSKFPPVTAIEKFKQTQFTPALENRIDNNKNVIYAPAFLYAWAELKQTLNCPLVTNEKNSIDLQLVDRSRYFKNALDKGEYQARVSVDGEQINAEASFNMVLPFSSKLQKLPGGVLFNNARVQAFGMDSLEDRITAFTDIVYYKDDDHFILSITPRDSVNTIILAKGIESGNSLRDAMQHAIRFMINGERESAANQNTWKFSFNPGDKFSIPVIKFNIESNYNHIAGQTITCNGTSYLIDIAKQRTAFIFDENGAEVESEALSFAADSVAIPEKVHPKNMALNKPFLIMIGKKRRPNPYFVMWVRNTELMEVKVNAIFPH